MRAAFAVKAGRRFVFALAMAGVVCLFGSSPRSNCRAEVNPTADEHQWQLSGASAVLRTATIEAEGQPSPDDEFGRDQGSHTHAWRAKSVRQVYAIAIHGVAGEMHSGIPLMSPSRGNSQAARWPLAGSTTSRTIVLQRLLL